MVGKEERFILNEKRVGVIVTGLLLFIAIVIILGSIGGVRAAEETPPDWDNVDLAKLTKDDLAYYNNHFNDPSRMNELTNVISKKLVSGELNANTAGPLFDNLKREVFLQISKPLLLLPNSDKFYKSLSESRMVTNENPVFFPRNLELLQVALTGKEIVSGNELSEPPTKENRLEVARILMGSLSKDTESLKLMKEFTKSPDVGTALAEILNENEFTIPIQQQTRNTIYQAVLGVEKIDFKDIKLQYNEDLKEFLTEEGTFLRNYGELNNKGEKTSGLASITVKKGPDEKTDYIVFQNKAYKSGLALDEGAKGREIWIKNGEPTYIGDTPDKKSYGLYNVFDEIHTSYLGDVSQGNSGRITFDGFSQGLKLSEGAYYYNSVNQKSADGRISATYGQYAYMPEGVSGETRVGFSLVGNGLVGDGSLVIPSYSNSFVMGGKEVKGNFIPEYGFTVSGKDGLSVADVVAVGVGANYNWNLVQNPQASYVADVAIFHGTYNGNSVENGVSVKPGNDEVSFWRFNSAQESASFSVRASSKIEAEVKGKVNLYILDSTGTRLQRDYAFEQIADEIRVKTPATHGVEIDGPSIPVPSPGQTPTSTLTPTPTPEITPEPIAKPSVVTDSKEDKLRVVQQGSVLPNAPPVPEETAPETNPPSTGESMIPSSGSEKVERDPAPPTPIDTKPTPGAAVVPSSSEPAPAIKMTPEIEAIVNGLQQNPPTPVVTPSSNTPKSGEGDTSVWNVNRDGKLPIFSSGAEVVSYGRSLAVGSVVPMSYGEQTLKGTVKYNSGSGFVMVDADTPSGDKLRATFCTVCGAGSSNIRDYWYFRTDINSYMVPR
ncbi:hypothetical protein J4218_03450 [Candidatus Pacearchaeota archaeon]|nr:hypothetical protein [Candidatus Pacearchaeota archaeon]